MLGRKNRVEYYGAMYHIIQKVELGNEEDKMMILQILGEVKDMAEYNLLSYCILDDRYHIVIKTLNLPVSNIMQRINTRYSKYYSKNYDSEKSPLNGRYRAIIINNENNLLPIINYVHNKPVYIDMVKGMEEYKWSSDFLYKMNMDSIVDIDFLFSHLSTEREIALKKYIEAMLLPNEDSIGLIKRYENSSYIGEDKRKPLDEILKSVCRDEEIYKLIKNGSKKGHIIPIKGEYASLAKLNGYKNGEIGKNIGVSERTIREYLKQLTIDD